MPSDLTAPGLKTRPNRDGTKRIYWCARADLVKAGYRPETVRLPYSLDDSSQHVLITAACMRLQAEMLEWSGDRRGERDRFDGTIQGLSRRYQVDEASPFNTSLKHNTKRTDLYTLKTIEAAFGQRSLAALKIGDFRRWYDAAKAPKLPGGPPRIRRAWGIIKKLRELFAYGIMAELPECKRLYEVLQHARFAQPARRRIAMELTHAEAFIAKAVETGRLSLALGTAIQFETALRQKDVIGEWEPIPRDDFATGIVLNGRRWVRGLTWTDLGSDLVIRKVTSKTGAIAAHDLKLHPMVLTLLDKIPIERRVGPLIIDEGANRPYAEWVYGREWRAVADAAGLPAQVWNMDARAGALTEADDAGAELDQIRATAAHTQASTTVRYLRGGVGKSRAIASLRAAHRAAKNEG